MTTIMTIIVTMTTIMTTIVIMTNMASGSIAIAINTDVCISDRVDIFCTLRKMMRWGLSWPCIISHHFYPSHFAVLLLINITSGWDVRNISKGRHLQYV